MGKTPSFGGVDISLLGDKKLQRTLDRLRTSAAMKVVRSARKKRATRVHRKIVRNLSGDPVAVRTGTLRSAFKATKPKTRRSKRIIFVGIPLPERSLLGIDAKAKGYYPTALEYGTRYIFPRRYIRGAADEDRNGEDRKELADIAKGITREAKKQAARKR